MIRIILTKITEGVIKRFWGNGRPGETLENREFMQHYGFTSRPLPGAEGIVLQRGNLSVMVAEDDRRHRKQLEHDGEAALWTHEGDYMYFKKGNIVELKTNELRIIGDIKITGNITLKGNLSVEGKITSTDDIVSDKVIKGKTDVVFPNSVVPGAFISGSAHTHPVAGALASAATLPPAV